MFVNTISIDPYRDKFFISINTQGFHSFIMLGIYQQNKDQNQVQHVLCRVGKFAKINKNDSECIKSSKFICQALFTSYPAELHDEEVYRESGRARPINYQAYDITYTQYLEFVSILASLQTNDNSFCCFQPEDNKENTNKVLFKYKIVTSKEQKQVTEIENSAHGLCITNTCRHTAIKLVEETRHAPISSSVSSLFFRDLPCKTYLRHGKPTANIPFYVMPIPPVEYKHLDAKSRQILEKLYKRMECLPLIASENLETQDKFDCLKDLYNQIARPRKDLSIDDLLSCIHQWKKQNLPLISSLRQYTLLDLFWSNRQSATQKLVQEIEKDLSPNQAP